MKSKLHRIAIAIMAFFGPPPPPPPTHSLVYIADVLPQAKDEPVPPVPQFDINQAIEEARATLAASPHLSPKARQMLCDMTWTPSHERVTSVCQA